MKPRLSVLTLGVTDLDRAVAFYRDGLGLPTQGIVGREFEHGAVAFFELSGGCRLALWAQADIAYETGLAVQPVSPTAVTLGHNVMQRHQVDEIMQLAQQAGARIVKSAQATSYGVYAGYFSDPDGHLWEIVWNPEMLPGDET